MIDMDAYADLLAERFSAVDQLGAELQREPSPPPPATRPCPARVHDTQHAYSYYRCRCPKAIEAHSASLRASRARQARPRPPLDVDELAVTQACQGYRMRLNIAERREVVRRLTVAGLSTADIAVRLAVHNRTVCRDRAALRRQQADGETFHADVSRSPPCRMATKGF